VRLVRDPAAHAAYLKETGAERIAGPQDVARVLGYLRAEEVEVVVVLALDVRSRVTGLVEITRGLVSSSLVHPREVFRNALALGAVGIIVAHNHPSGDPTPSAEDHAVTRQLVAAGQLLDLPVYDHVILGGDDRLVSMASAGLL